MPSPNSGGVQNPVCKRMGMLFIIMVCFVLPYAGSPTGLLDLYFISGLLPDLPKYSLQVKHCLCFRVFFSNSSSRCTGYDPQH
jgi:hypothetical protein